METEFIPIDYDYFDFEGRNYIKIIGRDNFGKRVCVIDSCDVFLWAILKDNLQDKKIKSLIKKIEKIKLDIKGRKTRVEKVEIHDRNFLDKPVKALKIFGTNYKDLHNIADELGMEEIDKRRGYDLGYVTHYIMEKNLSPLKWYNVKGEMLNNSQEFGGIDMSLDVDFCIHLKSFKEINRKFKPKVLAYDIECDELKIGAGEILMVSLVGNNRTKKVITWKKTSKKLSYVDYVEDEAELLEKFCAEVRKISPDFLVGYHSDGFDLPYFKARAEKFNVKLNLGLDDSQPRFSRGNEMTGKIKGIVHIDILKFIRTAYAQYMKSETLSLNEVAKEFLKDTKKEFKFEHSSVVKNWEKYYEYNLHDSVLTLGLFEKFWPDIAEFSKTIQEPVFNISRAGLSKYVENYVLHNLEKFKEIPEKRPGYDEIGSRKGRGKVEGAFVLEPKPGLYKDIAMFDFTSMHTSIIISHNISKGTLLKNKEKNSYASPDLELNGEKQKFYFSKKQGFFPELLNEIFKLRKKHKLDYKKNPNPITLARSNAFKVLSASVHGYIGFFGASYYSIEASASILSLVRKFNQDTIKKIEDLNFEVIYGDSVEGKTKVIVKEKEKIKEIYIEDLFKKVDKESTQGKEYNFKKNIKVLTLNEKGQSVFKPAIYVMRHKCKKKMYRIHFTNNWNIDVTEDHSLMGYQEHNFNQSKKNKENTLKRIIEIKPEEIKKKANSIISLSKIPSKKIKSRNYPKKIYEFMGFFIGDGSFCRNNSHTKTNKDYYLGLSLGLDKEELIKNLILPLKNLGYIKNYWISKTREGDIKLNGLKLIDIISKNLRSDKGKKIIPKWFFDEKEENIASFLRGLFSADGTVMIRNKAPIIKFTSINEDYIKEVRLLLYRCGISHSIFKENTLNKYKTSNKSYSKNIIIKDKEMFAKKIGFIIKMKNEKANIKTKNQQKKNINEFEFDLQGVEKVEKINTPKYVYDIEVEDNHRFFANYVLIHNTDSIAFLQNGKSEYEIKKVLNKLNKELPGIMELELEDFYKRGLWVTTRAGIVGAKKKYALIDKNNKLKIRGFETVRRDWCKLARELQNKVLDKILKEGNEKNALDYVKNIIQKIKQRKIPLESLIIKTQLKKPIADYKAITPHVIAARRMIDLEIPVSEGNLILYYISETEGKSKLVRDKVKLPNEEGKYDIEYYLKKQILPAIENIFQVFGVNVEGLVEDGRQKKLF
ncbi:MAG: DNA polymerase domain-containing protein [Nanoarchaeota archaeon]|nr:DNA polymerase domain-containing protein [Nanoarchaeota archaeon]